MDSLKDYKEDTFFSGAIHTVKCMGKAPSLIGDIIFSGAKPFESLGHLLEICWNDGHGSIFFLNLSRVHFKRMG